MQQEWLKGIVETIDMFKEDVSTGDKLLENFETMNVRDILDMLYNFFEKKEKDIEKRLNSVEIENEERNISSFATKLVITMVSSHEQLKSFDSYKKLLGQRYFAYGFYNSFELEDTEEKNKYNSILEDTVFNEKLYLGLVKFYENFYGFFSDNEKAIKLLCKFYPKEYGVFTEEKNKEIVCALYRHITNAGTPNDKGFAYKGIELISKNIGNLPFEVIELLLRKYELYKILNDKVYRHQIFSIIEGSVIDEEKKPKYKFWYLDSLLLANQMNNNLYEKYTQRIQNLIPQFYSTQVDLSKPEIVLAKIAVTEEIYAYWTNDCLVERRFVVGKEKENVINISLDEENNKICIKYYNDAHFNLKFEFNNRDWFLHNYHSKETAQKLHDFVFERKSGGEKIVYNNLKFSLLYLDKYRAMNGVLVDFDHKFTYEKNNKELRESVKGLSYIPHFYGNTIYSLSCIVGKNGTGKTSAMDFLRETFFKLLYLILENKVACENGFIRKQDYELYDILDQRCEFLVVFHLGEQPFYLTNIEHISVTLAKPFSSGVYKSVKELSKVVYFSTILSANQDNLYIDEGTTFWNKSTENELSKSLNNFRQVDYSETESFVQKRKGIELAKQKNNNISVVNENLCYQLAFLDHLTKEKLCCYFDMQEEKKFILTSATLGKFDREFTVSKSINWKDKDLKKFLISPDAKLEHFSSGQYSKFSFLAKLYWFLEGYNNYIQKFVSILGTNVFDNSKALLEDETALIFIDEGELYYHPEWQRSYIKTLIDYIHDAETKSELQVVITTNSPFIISDILSEDITYLSKGAEKLGLTFGQNIHKLLKENFFMSYTIGEYSREMIDNIMKWLNYKGNNSDANFSADVPIDVGIELSRYFGKTVEPYEYYEKIRCIIEKIGEPIYRESLLDRLIESDLGKESKRELLLRKKSDIDRQLKELEG